MTTTKICATCGTWYPENTLPGTRPSDLPGTTSFQPADTCPICADDRQYIPAGGQRWTTETALHDKHSVKARLLRPNVYELELTPTFAIGQRAILILSPEGNILWDCIPLLDETLITFIKAKGGLRAIAFSHPHYYSNMHQWACTFDCPIYIHSSDKQWTFGKEEKVTFWEGEELPLWNDMRLINLGGHFPGSSILHVPHLTPKGTLFTGDTLVLSLHKKHISVMYSYPNRMPLPRKEVQRINDRMSTIPFDALYSFMHDLDLTENTNEIFNNSMARYLQ